jgi:kynurenine formamidase
VEWKCLKPTPGGHAADRAQLLDGPARQVKRHVYLLPQKGIYLIENVYLEELARDRRYTFAFVGIPLKRHGATGSPLRPLALVEKEK